MSVLWLLVLMLMLVLLATTEVVVAAADNISILWETRDQSDLVLQLPATDRIVCVALDSQGRIDCLHDSNEVVLPGAADGLPHTIHLLELGGVSSTIEMNGRESSDALAVNAEPRAAAEAIFIDPLYAILRHFLNDTLDLNNPPGSERLELRTIEGERKLLSAAVPPGPWQVTLYGLQPGTFYAEAAVYSSTAAAAALAKQTVLFEAVLTAEELLAARHLHVHGSVAPLVNQNQQQQQHQHQQQQQQQQQQRKIRLCFVGSLVLDGQKSIWLQQIAKLPRDR
jgi:hypothetical protein